MSLWSTIRRAFSAPRPAPLAEMAADGHHVGRPIRGRYDAAQTTDDNVRHWAAADSLDADSANSPAVRKRIVQRARYETENNGHGKGIVLTHANYVVGRGPRLRIKTASRGMNAMVEAAWLRWCKAVKLARKLRTQVKGKVRDGEGILVARQNPGLRDTVKLDVVPIECEQLATPNLVGGEEGKIDGIEFDAFGNPTFYTILKRHPGASWWSKDATAVDRYPAKFVFHLFREDRAGQHRAVSELSATLGLFAGGRRWREATLAAAENIADFSLFLKSQLPADAEPTTSPMSTLEIERRMMVALPWGTEPFQPKAEQPAANYSEFNRSQVCEEARPLNMPYNIAAADSSDYSFSGGRLDHLTYFVSVDVEQSEIEDLVLDPLFDLWFAEAVRIYGWAFDAEPAPPHEWMWPAKPQIDDQKTASARQTSLGCGATSLRRIHSEDGIDTDDMIAEIAEDYDVDEAEVRKKLFAVNFTRASAAAPGDGGDKTDAADEPPKNGNGRPVNRLPARNGNGRPYAGVAR